MGYSSRNKVFDAHREKTVIETEEEKVRQKLFKHLTKDLGFPKEFVAMEKKLSELPLEHGVPYEINRRIDLLCFTWSKNRMVPLLLIECKAVRIDIKEKDQLIGYNAWVGAPFIALVNHEQTLTGYFDRYSKIYQFVSGLFSYDTLIRSIKNHE